jgi:hypothetical protein
VATTTAPAPDSQASAPAAPAAPAAESRPAAAPAPTAEAAEAAPTPSRAPYETGSSLLAPPDYDNIVGGVPPSPYASLILLAGLIGVVIGTVGAVMGADLTQWWVIGAGLVVVAVFLAGFVSRS